MEGNRGFQLVFSSGVAGNESRKASVTLTLEPPLLAPYLGTHINTFIIIISSTTI